MQFTLTHSGPPLSIDEIKSFALELGYELDPDYASFLLRNNGGIPADLVTFDSVGNRVRVGLFDSLMPSQREGLRINHSKAKERLAVDFILPIATANYVKSIFIDLKTSAVYLAPDDDENVHSCNALLRVADTFNEFLEMLEVSKRPVDVISELGIGTVDDLRDYLANPGTSINDVSPMNNRSIACEAAKRGNIPVLKMCLLRGADMTDSLDLAIKNKHLEAVKLLVEGGCCPYEATSRGNLPIDSAVGIEGKPIREYLENVLSNPPVAAVASERHHSTTSSSRDNLLVNAFGIYSNSRHRITRRLIQSTFGVRHVQCTKRLFRSPKQFDFTAYGTKLCINTKFDKNQISPEVVGMHGWVEQLHDVSPILNRDVFHRFIDEINQIYGVTAHPGIQFGSELWSMVLDLARPVEGVLFVDDTFVDCDGRILFGLRADFLDLAKDVPE